MRAIMMMMLSVAGLLAARPVHAATEWAEVKTTHFTIYGKKSDKDLPRLATRLEMLNRLLATVLNMPEDSGEQERPLIVYVVAASDVTDTSGTPHAAGYYAADKRNGYAVVTRGKSTDTFDAGQEIILFHEFAHHFMDARSSSAYPAWFVEGFAEFFATLEFKEGNRVTFGNPPMYRAPQLVMSDLYPIDKLLRGTAAGLSLADGDRYYGAAWLLTHYLYLTPARGKEFQVYLNDLASTGGAKDIGTYFQGGEKALAKELQAYVRGKLKGYIISLPVEGLSVPQVRVLGPDENAMLMQELRYRRPMDGKLAEALATDIQQTAARYPDSAYAQSLLADVLADLQKWEPAMVAADAAIRLDPQNARAHAVRAEILLGRDNGKDDERDEKAALKAVVAANRADLNDPYPLFLYFQIKRMHGPPPDIAFEGLRKAYLQLPQYTVYRWSYANALAERKDYAEAIGVITPLANDPHGGRGAASAQQRRDEFIAMRDGKPLPDRASRGEGPEKDTTAGAAPGKTSE